MSIKWESHLIRQVIQYITTLVWGSEYPSEYQDCMTDTHQNPYKREQSSLIPHPP